MPVNTSDKFLLGLIAFLVGLALLQKPNCRRGCRTTAEHLLTDGLDEMVATLFA
jgi:hypothetical protein